MKIRRRIPNGSQTNNSNKKSKQPNIIIPLIVAILVIIGGIYYIKTSFSNIINGNNNLSGTNLTGVNEFMKYFIGDSFSNSGVILPVEGNINYSQMLLVDSLYQFGLKSNDFLLSEYTGSVLVNGEVVDVFDSIPVVLVTDIVKLEDEVIVDQEQQEEETIINNHSFPEYGLSINFEMLTGYKVSQQGKDINILKISQSLNESDSLVLTITPYECKVGSSTQDCERIINNYTKLGMSSFTTTNGVKFYKFSETERHLFFNSSVYGFNVIPKSSSEMDALASYIFIDDYTQLKESILPNISKICTNENGTLKTVSKFDLIMNNGILFGTVSGKDVDGNNILCKIRIGSKDSKKFTLVDFQTDKVATPVSNVEELSDEAVESTINNLEVSNTVNPLVDTGSYLSFTSNLGFTVHLPKYVAYEGVVIDPTEDLGYDTVQCSYKINVTNYKNKDLLSISPSAQIFYCNSQGNINTSGRPIKKVDSSNGTFLILYSNDEGRKIGDEIIIE